MPGRKSFTSILREAERLDKKNEAFRKAANSALAKAAEKARKDYERAAELNEKQRAKLYAESREANVALKNEELDQQIDEMQNLLNSVLSRKKPFDLENLKRSIPHPKPHWPQSLEIPETAPNVSTYSVPGPTGLKKLLPGEGKKHELELSKARDRFKIDVHAHSQREIQRQKLLEQMKKEYEEKKREYTDQLAKLDKLKFDFSSGSPQAIVEYFTLLIESSDYPDSFPVNAKMAYIPESKQLVIEYDLPTLESVPQVGEYKYVSKTDEIASKPRSDKQRKLIYSDIIAQTTLRTLFELFSNDTSKYIDTIVFNGMVDTIDKGTGRPVRPCLITVRTTRDVFESLDLSKVDPTACLKVLSASVSKSPAELVPVRPVLEFNMVDKRFIQETDVLSNLDNRSNLMELTPTEFESLITNLFEKMGLETRQTQASRDGGVDCVAFDPRPIFGGKVVIQAKRYKHTVGVSAVRDLFGTMQNEGASKGILVTTSGYGKASFEFASGKPLELLDGSNLLYLLAQHAGIEAKIEPPDTWKDPQADAPYESAIASEPG